MKIRVVETASDVQTIQIDRYQHNKRIIFRDIATNQVRNQMKRFSFFWVPIWVLHIFIL